MSVRRIYVEKKKEFAVKAKELKKEISNYLGISGIEELRILIRYDIENISDEIYKKAVNTIFHEPPLDEFYEEEFSFLENDFIFSVEYLPGQFDQRADSAKQCIQILKSDEEIEIKTATTYIISGGLSPEEKAAIKRFCINPVDSRQAVLDKPETLINKPVEPEDIQILEGFISLDKDKALELYKSLDLAMTFEDFSFIKEYFIKENRNPCMTEIKVLDTYWSDHCRHTTFLTKLKNIEFEEGFYKKRIKESYLSYLASRKEVYKDREEKSISLMDIALVAMKKLRLEGKLNDLEESDEINACSIIYPVCTDGKKEEWLISFKNETHNHPTEIEPFGGAATCLGGAIRDPLSGRTYVYQAMRITGAADPREALSDTLDGKLAQRKIVTGAASGYSSYGNQIGLATGYVKEIYHEGYKAKRLEIGAVIGAAKREGIIRRKPAPGDIIILLGGRTGRDGCGGATGSSKIHTTASIDNCGAEVQKGNAPTERKIQRLFKNQEVTRLIKKCNDFGAGGVAVAIGELADGLIINLDAVPKKYDGLNATEIAISESQERMAVVISNLDKEKFVKYAKEENLEATVVAQVIENKRLIMNWRGKTVVDISREFLDTNGVAQEADILVKSIDVKECPFERSSIFEDRDIKASLHAMLSDINVCSQKGLVEMFDSSIGASTVLMPYGGKYQLSPIQTMVSKLPFVSEDNDTVTMMSYGYDPYLSSWSSYHGGAYAVLDSVAKIVAAGGNYKNIHFTFQEYFNRLNKDAGRWGEPFKALLGAYDAQIGFELAAIGGKDSMSGSFNDMDVPPTLVSFAVNISEGRYIISPEFKKEKNKIILVNIQKDMYHMPIYTDAKKKYSKIFEAIKENIVSAAYAMGGFGIAHAITEMMFGNKLGAYIYDNIERDRLFMPAWGDIIMEVDDSYINELDFEYELIGEVLSEPIMHYGSDKIDLEELIHAWEKPLSDVFPVKCNDKNVSFEVPLYELPQIYICKNKVARPNIFIPVLPGTNCEYDLEREFIRAGADVNIKVFRNIYPRDIQESVDEFEKAISQAQIIMFPGGFSAGDEPDGSAKFFATVFRNNRLENEVGKLLNNRDGLILGICNGFQALIKLGLLPDAKIGEQTKTSPTLAVNSLGKHVSKMVNTRIISNKSPWLYNVKPGEIYTIPSSHGEGRFIAPVECIDRLIKNGQVATQYVDLEGKPGADEEWNPNGSYMAIEGITSMDGRIFGKMAHSERCGNNVSKNIYGNKDMKIFKSGVEYFR